MKGSAATVTVLEPETKVFLENLNRDVFVASGWLWLTKWKPCFCRYSLSLLCMWLNSATIKKPEPFVICGFYWKNLP